MEYLRFTTADGSPPFMGIPLHHLHSQGFTSSPLDVTFSQPGQPGVGPSGPGGYTPGPNGPYVGNGYPGYPTHPGYGGYPQAPPGGMAPQQPYPPSSPYNQPMQPHPGSFGSNGPYWLYYPPGSRRENPGQMIASSTVELGTTANIENFFPSPTAIVNVVEMPTPPWENPSQSFKWRPHRAPTSMTIKELIEQICPETGLDGKKITSRGVAECLEYSGGSWLKATEYWLGERGNDDNMKRKVEQRIGEVGWNETRGQNNRPVWLSCLIVSE